MKIHAQPNNVDLLFCLRGADMQSTADQALAAVGQFHNANNSVPFSKFAITDLFIVRATGLTNGTCTGGIYTASGKPAGADQIVIAAAQSWLGLTGIDRRVKPTTNALYNDYIYTLPVGASGLFLSLTTGSSTACTADVYVFGFPLY